MPTILVLTTEVASLADDFQVEGTDVPEQYKEYDLNEWDNYAVEAGVQLSEAGDDVEVVSATIGPSRSEETIRMVLAMGADRAIRVWDDALQSVDILDVEAKTKILARIVAQEEPDLVLSGVQSGDNSFAATGVSVAEEADYQWTAVVNDLTVDWKDATADVRRELEGGVEELTAVNLPAVLTIQSGINEPRYASLRGMRQAQRKPLDVFSLADLDLEPATAESSLTLQRMAEPESESDVELFEGDTEDAALQLAETLHEKGVNSS